MFTSEQIPELTALTPKQKAFVLMLPLVKWNQSEAARRVYDRKQAGYNTCQIKTNKVEVAIQAVLRAIEAKSIADDVWTFEQARAESLKILRLCEEHYLGRKATPVRCKWMMIALKVIHELNVQHGYLRHRIQPAQKVYTHVYQPEKRSPEVPIGYDALPEQDGKGGVTHSPIGEQ